jgi:hypothetical protein
MVCILAMTMVPVGATITLTGLSAGLGWALVLSALALGSAVLQTAATGHWIPTNKR